MRPLISSQRSELGVLSHTSASNNRKLAVGGWITQGHGMQDSPQQTSHLRVLSSASRITRQLHSGDPGHLHWRTCRRCNACAAPVQMYAVQHAGRGTRGRQ